VFPKCAPMPAKSIFSHKNRNAFSLSCFISTQHDYIATMEHAGVSFPEEYVPHGIKMLYDGKPIDLTPLQEEAATFFAGMDPDGMHLGNANTAPIFIKNFFEDFKEILGKGHVVKDFKKCDFEPIRRHLNEQKIIKKAITDEQRKANKCVRYISCYLYIAALI
jgi:DNA topoisomerase I